MAKPNILVRAKKAKASELLNSNQLQEADSIYAAICKATPSDAESWVLRALIHRKLGLFGEAEAFCRRALQFNSAYAWGQHMLGSVLQCQGRMDEALACYRKAISLDSDHPETHYFLANALRETGMAHEAAASYRRAIQLHPNYLEALSNLGALLTSLGDVQEAVRLLNKAMALSPGAPQIHCNLGQILEREGQFVDALEKYRRAAELAPDALDARINLASLLEKTNKLEEAAELVNGTLLRAPDDPALLLVAARLARRANEVDDAVAMLEKALGNRPSPGVAGDIHFLLGQMYDKKNDSERAYAHFMAANQLSSQATGTSGDQDKYLERVRRMHGYLSPQLSTLQASHPLSAEEANPVFLMGFQRSGTTLLEQILDSHPALQSIEEKPTVAAMVSAFEDMAQGRKDALTTLTDAQVSTLREIYFKEVARHIKLQPGGVLVDKMPLNTINVHLIWRVFPQAKFIFAARHPCDVCLSCFMQNFVMNESNAGFVSLESAAKVYSEVMQIWRDATRLLPLDYHRIRYEDLVSDFENETRDLLEFLGVGWHDSVLGHTDHAARRGTIRTPSYHQVTRPIYQDAKYRWKRYAKQFEPVMPTLKPFIDYFGYVE